VHHAPNPGVLDPLVASALEASYGSGSFSPRSTISTS